MSWDETRVFVETLIREAQDLGPTTFRETDNKSEPLTLDIVAEQFKKRPMPQTLWFASERDDISVRLSGFDDRHDPGLKMIMRIPMPLVVGRGETIFSLALELCRAWAPLYGWGHSLEDVRLGKDPNLTNTWAPKQVYQAYWLTILGASIVKKLGRTHVAATPGHRVEILKNGAALIVTSPDPADIAVPAAREAQARSLLHLRSDLSAEEVGRELLDRSATLPQYEAASAAPQRSVTSPDSDVTEWRPASEAPSPDVDDVEATVRTYRNEAEDFISGFHDEIENLISGEPDSLRRIDAHFVAMDYWRKHDVARLEQLFVPSLGAYLGTVLERSLGGRWAPRRNLEESQLIVGDRAFLPFLRVKHFVQSRQAAVDYSLAAFFYEATRHAQAEEQT
ncbi:MAG TPA: hypothetical protein VFV34_08915 [Blastocatellia bacterium]|nr:hypothetical protein [Blastocatellia bacterium]